MLMLLVLLQLHGVVALPSQMLGTPAIRPRQMMMQLQQQLQLQHAGSEKQRQQRQAMAAAESAEMRP